MKAIELEKSYNPASFEDAVYLKWRESGAFTPFDAGSGFDNSFTIVIPPPNVTGILHMGHALNITLQDLIIRYQRMCGRPVLWVPGTDHAGIATQHIVERSLRERGQTRHELGREKFIEETWKIKEEHHSVISKQIAKLGASVDWSRERFTLDAGLSAAVREVFVTLFERGLIYKGEYLVNWCCSCGTALADDEVEHEDTPGKMYHLRYPRSDGKGFVELATTRPETLLGDTAVAVHGGDERYCDLIGKMVRLPLTDREIPVVADSYVDREFGTGVVKITPAHDPNDWNLGRRHNLPVINILNSNGTLNDNVPEAYRGLAVKDARAAVLAALKDGGFFVKEEEIVHVVGHCYRCGTVIEPFLSKQWFVKMKPLADKALDSWRRGEIVFYPHKWEHTYQHWLENIRDWCVSRQLWWGHRIPAWTCASCGAQTVSRKDINRCPQCGGTVSQETDVLDTWFSSWLWPFSTLGWPESSADYDRFYPTTALVTAYDIIFFWVSRMIMAGLEFTGKAPFHDVYIHGLLRDKQGRKMSKSLGNGIDPLELIKEYGADAVKFTFAFLCAQGQDIFIDKESFKLGSKFANKVWNASRYILMNLDGCKRVENPELMVVDRWIYSRLAASAKIVSTALENYRFNEAASTVHEYFWNDFCDWYVEATKLSTRSSCETEKNRAVTILLDVLAESLRLLHPFLPFITEEIWAKLAAATLNENPSLLITERYPCGKDDDAKIEEKFSALQELVRAIRTMRSECTVPPEKKIRARALVEDSGSADFIRQHTALIIQLANLNEIIIESSEMQSGNLSFAVATVGAGFEVFVFIADAVDIPTLLAKWRKDVERDRKFIAGLEAKLFNENFIANAPRDLIDAERAKLEEVKLRTGKIEGYINRFAAVENNNYDNR